MMSEPTAEAYRILKGFSTLGTLTGIYPAGHPLVTDKVREIYEAVQPSLAGGESVRIDVVRGVVHLNGVPVEGQSEPQAFGIDSLHIYPGVQPEEIAAAAEVLRRNGDDAQEPVSQQFSRRGVHHISVGRLVPLDTRWRARQWPDHPQHVLDPDYEQSLLLAQQAFEVGRRRAVKVDVDHVVCFGVIGMTAMLDGADIVCRGHNAF